MSKAATMRVLEPAPNILAFYDGRIPGRRLHSPDPNWLDDGGYTLGTASYAIVDGADALVYDTHMTLDHARAIRSQLEARGARRIIVILSHHHLDHIAGNAVFADCPILANRATARAMEAARASAEQDDPPVSPVVMPNLIFETGMEIRVGSLTLQALSFDIHSHDGLVLWLPETRCLLAGDTLEDTCTYVAEPARLAGHLGELDRLGGLNPSAILPNHGDPDVIAAGGYRSGLIGATQDYIRALLECAETGNRAGMDLDTFLTNRDEIRYHAAYEAVHRRNIEAVRGN